MSGHQEVGTEGRIFFVIAAVFLTFVGQEYTDEGWALWYQTEVMGVPAHYFLFAGMVLLLWPILRQRPPMNVTENLRESGLWLWVILGWITLMLALVLAVFRQASEPFADWRNWVILAITTIVVAKLVVDRMWRQRVLTDLALGYGLLSAVHLALWLGGGGIQLFDIRIPLFDGYDLSLAVFASVVAAESWIRGFPGMTRVYALALRVSFFVSTALVMLSFRRTLWTFVVLSMISVTIWGWRAGRASRAHVGKILGATAVLVVVAVMVLGPEAVSERLASFNPVARNAYTATNEDHVNDLRDALTVIADEPLLGLGIGSTYDTILIAHWKTESFEVHNAFIHSWLKFGLLGVVTYIGFHVALGMAYLRLGARGAVGFTAAGIALFTEQVMSLVETWPYAGFGYAMARGVVLGVFLAIVHGDRYDPRPPMITAARPAVTH